MTPMQKRGIVGTALVTAALALVLSFRTPDAPSLAADPRTPGAGGPTVTGFGTYSGQITGDAVQTPFGNLQVQVTIQNGRITDVQPVQFPNDNPHSYQISQYALPQLRSAVLSAQSAQVDTVSGATYTSFGYLQSLQSALDRAH